MGDFYTANPDELKGQPKATIADYVEQNGILVPKRFATFDEARQTGLDIIARSEHMQDYAGVSGLFLSKHMGVGCSLYENEDALVEDVFMFSGKINRFCGYRCIEFEVFKEASSFSYWEYLNGYNRKIVADSAIKGRYHITTYRKSEDDDFFMNYCIFENGKVIRSFLSDLTGDLLDGLPVLIEIYENVRTLDKFDPNHCLIMEVQTSEGKDYFLQYHIGRDFKASSFVLERESGKDEIEVILARGASEFSEGRQYKATVAYHWKSHDGWGLSNEEASFDLHHNTLFTEFMTRRRKLQIMGILESENIKSFLESEFIYGHVCTAQFFKPEVSVVVNLNTVITSDEMKAMRKKAFESGQHQYIDVHLVSDGRRAFLKRV